MNNASRDYLELNRKSWDTRTPFHLASEFYDLPGFRKGISSLNEIELDLLGDVTEQRVLHLQCHFGQDTLSLARMGAQVTGVDFSSVAIGEARKLASELGIPAEFLCCDVYDLPAQLDAQFDVVFTSYGAIGWLPDLSRWAQVIRRFLKPGGKFVLVEFHPVVWMFDDEFQRLQYSYFNTGPIAESSSGTYADLAAPIQLESVGWNHPISEVLGSLLANGLTLRHFAEYDYSPYGCFAPAVKVAERKYRIPHLGEKIPMVYSLVAAG